MKETKGLSEKEVQNLYVPKNQLKQSFASDSSTENTKLIND